MAFKIDRESFYSPDEIAELLGVSVRTLGNWRCAGKGPAACTGRSRSVVWYSGAAVLSYLNEQAARPPSEAA